MIQRSVLLSALAVFLGACGSAPPAPPAPPEPAPAEPAPVVSAPPAEPTPPEPTPEEKAAAEARAKLEQDTRDMEQKARVEAERWTPEMHTNAKALAEAKYPSARAAFAKLQKSSHRVPGNADRDQYRHPLETLEFFGLKPTMTVLEVGPGEGWYTEFLAPTLAARGQLIVTNSDPNGPATERGTMYGRRFQLFQEKAPELYGKIQTIVIDPKAPSLGLAGTLDLVIVMRGMHGWQQNGAVGAWLAQIHAALKPKGVLGIEQHRATAGQNPDESAKRGYLDEAWVVAQVEAAGFKLAQKSELNANPKDTKDYPEGVWSLPPTLRQGDTDRAKYVAIGETDRMTLRFVKVAPKSTGELKTGG